MPSPGAGGAGMHVSIRGAGTLQSKHATAKPSVPFTSNTAETSKAGESCREPSGKEGASCPTARPGALELRYVGTVAASAGRQRLRGWTAPADAQKGMPAFILCHLQLITDPTVRRKAARGGREAAVSPGRAAGCWMAAEHPTVGAGAGLENTARPNGSQRMLQRSFPPLEAPTFYRPSPRVAHSSTATMLTHLSLPQEKMVL